MVIKKQDMQQEKIPYYKWCYGKFILVGYITN
jgi:hypothetical protein